MARILIADDVRSIRMLLRHVLERGGHDVLEAGGGDEALDALHRELPDIAILDVYMPGLNGFEVCRAVRADPSLATMGLIILSGDVRAIQKWAARPDAWLAKPFSPIELLNAVTTLLRAPGLVRLPAAARQEAVGTTLACTVPVQKRTTTGHRRKLRKQAS